MIVTTNSRGQRTYIAREHVVAVKPHPLGHNMALVVLTVGEPVEIDKDSVDRFVRAVEGEIL